MLVQVSSVLNDWWIKQNRNICLLVPTCFDPDPFHFQFVEPNNLLSAGNYRFKV